MKYGVIIPENDVRMICDLAAEAEEAGWDGAFIADAVSIEAKGYPASPWFDVTVALAAMAIKTERIRIGTMICAPTRRRPWKLAREAQTIDHLSAGRLTLGVGLGAAEHDGGFYKVGEAMDLKTRAELLDEGLEIMARLWGGEAVSFKGSHYSVEGMTMLPATVQRPRVPVWVVGVWPKWKSMRRALRWDGVIPQKYKGTPGDKPNPELIRAIKNYVIENHPSPDSFDIIAEGVTRGQSKKRAAETARQFGEAGATWWIESTWSVDTKKLRARIKQGPPRSE